MLSPDDDRIGWIINKDLSLLKDKPQNEHI